MKVSRNLTFVGTSTLLVLLCGCEAGDASGTEADSKDASAGPMTCATFAGDADLYVGFGCPDAGADGSRDHPFARLADALAAAGDRSVIRLSAGDFEGATISGAQLRVIGAGEETTFTSPVRIEDGARVEMTDVQLQGVAGAAVSVRGGAQLSARNVSIHDVRTEYEGAPGVGVLASEGAGIILQDYVIDGCAGPAVLVNDSVAELRGGMVKANGAGIRIERGRGRSTIEDNTVTGNAQAGLALFSADAIVRGNRILDTTTDTQGFGEGIVAGELAGGYGPSHVQIEGDNEVRGNARVGVLLDAGATGAITGNRVEANGRAGIWVQGVPALDVTDNTLSVNFSAGIVLFGGMATVSRNTVADTLIGHFGEAGADVETADALAVLAAGDAEIHDNTLTGSARLGIVVDAATARISGNVVSGSPHGIILQDLPAPEAVSVDVADGVVRDPAEAFRVPGLPLGL